MVLHGSLITSVYGRVTMKGYKPEDLYSFTGLFLRLMFERCLQGDEIVLFKTKTAHTNVYMACTDTNKFMKAYCEPYGITMDSTITLNRCYYPVLDHNGMVYAIGLCRELSEELARANEKGITIGETVDFRKMEPLEMYGSSTYKLKKYVTSLLIHITNSNKCYSFSSRTEADKGNRYIIIGRNTEQQNAINGIELTPDAVMKEYEGYYYIPISYKEALRLRRNKLNRLGERPVTTDLKFAFKQSDCVVKVPYSVDLGKLALCNLPFRDYTILSK